MVAYREYISLSYNSQSPDRNKFLVKNPNKSIVPTTKPNDRRRTLQLLIGGSVIGAVWHKPLISSVLLPAHAQTSVMSTSIEVRSLDVDNPFARYILVVDSSDNVLANCGASGGTATVTGLAAGEYRVFSDSNGSQNQRITIITDAQTSELTIPTDTGSCDFLVATISLPSGSITSASGERISAPWGCSTNLGTNCS